MSSRREFLQSSLIVAGAIASKAALGADERTGSESAAGSSGRSSLFDNAPAPDDPLELLYSRRLAFLDGQPLVTVRVLEGRDEAFVRAVGPLTAGARNASGKSDSVFGKKIGAPGKWKLKLLEGQPGLGATWVELEQVRYADKDGRDASRAAWEARGVKTRLATVGDVYGIAGHVVDTRRWSLLAEGDATEIGAQAQAQQLAAKFGIRPQIYREHATRPSGRIALIDAKNKVVAEGQGAIELSSPNGLTVEQVEFGMGYAAHGFEQRTYPTRLFACVDAGGKLAVIAAVPMERLVKGVVPSEIFAKAHPEALKAQAVTARGEVLAKVGARHLGDPYLLCAEQHCQVYKGTATEQKGTSAAVDATRGEALFAKLVPNGDPAAKGVPRRLVDSVYSACCGGFSEDNDVVWGGPADPSLRGRPDFDLTSPGMAQFADGIGDALVSQFVHLTPIPSYCSLSGLVPKEKVRWHRAFSSAQVDSLCAPLGVGHVTGLAVEGRGVSGRARALRVEGTTGVSRIFSELSIRRQFQMLSSGMFVVSREGDAWVFTGGGWGHGSGMCQTGAIGRAQRGQTYRQILGWYYSGATPERVY
jgi:stage II sporulation protein D